MRSGDHIGAVGLEPRETIRSLSLVGDSVWLGGMNPEGWKAVGVVGIDDLFAMARRGSRDRPVPFLDRVAVPSAYVLNPWMFGGMNHTMLDVGSADFLVGFAGTPFLMRFAPGAAVDTLWLARRVRRGAPRMDFQDPQRPVDPFQMMNEVSVMAQLSRDERGNIFTVHQETEMKGRQVADVRLYVASASPDGSR